MVTGPQLDTDLPLPQQAPSDKRPKLERAHSAAEKENQPLQRSGSVLRRQYSEQEPRTPSCERYQQYNEDDPRFYQGELEGLMRTHPHLVPRRLDKCINAHVCHNGLLLDIYGELLIMEFYNFAQKRFRMRSKKIRLHRK